MAPIRRAASRHPLGFGDSEEVIEMILLVDAYFVKGEPSFGVHYTH